ncbi:MAG: sensor histidine kinase [Hungatella sp.]|nr:sensor histidine kinase [Hungatella sp.]
MKKIPITFRKRLILYNLLIIVCIAFTISIYTYSSYKKEVIANETASSVSRLHSLSFRLEMACDEMINIVQNCAGRKSLFLTSVLSGSETRSNKQTGIYASDVLKDLCAVSGYNQYIYKITMYEEDSLFIQAGTSSGSYNDADCLMAAPWFEELLNKDMREYTLTLKDNPFSVNTIATPKLLPLIRPLQYSKKDLPTEAWVCLTVSPKLFRDALELLPEGKSVFVMTDDRSVVGSMNMEDFSMEEIGSRLDTLPAQKGHMRTKLSGLSCVFTWERQPVSGLILCEVLPLDQMPLNPRAINATIGLVFVSSIAIGFILSLSFTRYLTRPITRLTDHMEVISSGDFRPNPDIETDDELGVIGRQINRMSSHVSELMENRIRDEQEKLGLEIKMLQAQINPHFLYNTLDSIKWIATMQHNSGIVKVVSALSSLLKNMAKGFNEKVTVRQELDFLDSYVTIEKIRYIELFDVDISVEDPSLYNAGIIKLTLQPLVENSIFSGIEPSGKPGLIQIHVFARDQVLYIQVRDNGVGMSEENIARMLTDTSRVTKHYMSGIGLPNVDRRLKLVYGEEYGLHIESQIGIYTCVTVSLPLEFV